MSEGAQSGDSSGLLATTKGTTANKETSILSPETTYRRQSTTISYSQLGSPCHLTRSPESASLVPEGLPLSGEVSVPRGNAKDESIIFLKLLNVGENWDGRLGGSMHLLQNLFREGLWELVEVCSASSSFNALLLGLSELLNMAVEGVLR